MELRKFPVTAPDGTEYRVTIDEYLAGFLTHPYAAVTLSVKRKHFGFRKIYATTYDDDGRSVYARVNPNYAALVTRALHDYAEDKRKHEERLAEVSIVNQHRQAAARLFAEWDGHIETEADV